MSDLIERLREAHKWGTVGTSIFGEAIDEIERLTATLAKDRRDIHTQRAAIGELQAELQYKLDQSERIKNLEAEIERLQAEIQRLHDQIRVAYEYGYDVGADDTLSKLAGWKEYCGVKE